MLNVKIVKPTVRVQPYTNKKGQPASLTFQEAWVFTIDEDGTPAPYPEKTEFIVPRDKATNEPKPYPVGDYTLHPSAVFIDQNGRLAASLRLTPQTKRT